MEKSSFSLEKKLYAGGYEVIIGIDEAGRGPLAGPVVAAATTVRNFQFPISNFQTPSSRAGLATGQANSNDQISNDKNWNLIRDSKMLSHKQREDVFDFIHEHFHVGVGICDHQTIDRINILEATYLAAKKAVSDLIRNKKQNTKNNNQNNLKTIILFDGNKAIPNLSMEQRAVVSGDKIVKSISAASIVAKVTRDRIMMDMHAKYPEYGFEKHKGYGTKMHMDALQKHGPCPIHRQSFKPVKLAKKGF